jgi:hypothetical protein
MRSGRRWGRIAVLLVVAAAAGGLVWYLEKSPPPAPEEPVLTPEAKAYTKHLELSGVEIKATENALGQTLVEILGQITNAGQRALALVELNCVFYDINGQEIYRERVPIVRTRDGVMQPGETRKFRLPFDTIPDGWNQAMPKLVIARIVFAD